jgi:hypothetical protein
VRIADDLVATEVERTDIEVMFLRTADEVAAMRRGWERLEELVGLSGRSFFGAFYPRTREYLLCARVEEGDDPAAFGLESGRLPGGRYLRARLRGEPPQVYDRIGPTFQALLEAAESDESRPSIEHYRRHDEIDLLLPIA